MVLLAHCYWRTGSSLLEKFCFNSSFVVDFTSTGSTNWETDLSVLSFVSNSYQRSLWRRSTIPACKTNQRVVEHSWYPLEYPSSVETLVPQIGHEYVVSQKSNIWMIPSCFYLLSDSEWLMRKHDSTNKKISYGFFLRCSFGSTPESTL